MKRMILAAALLTAAFCGGAFAQDQTINQTPQAVKVETATPPPAFPGSDRAALVVPSTINYQGKLLNAAGMPITAATGLEFRIYDGPGGGATLLWGPQATVVTPDVDGFYNVSLGTTPFPANLFDGVPRWLGVTVPPDPEMTPRQEMTSVAYAINADRLGGLTGSDYVKKAGDVMTGELGVLSGPYGLLAFSADTGSFLVGSSGGFANLVGVGGGAYTNAKFSATDEFQGPAANGAVNSFAILGNAEAGTASNTGVIGQGTGTSINRGVQGSASGGTENWSGYFINAPVRVGAGGLAGVNTATGPGDLYVADNLEVDGSITLPPGSVPAAGSVVLLGGSVAVATPTTLSSFSVTAPGPGFLLVNVAGQWWYNADATTAASITIDFDMGLCTAPASSATCGGTYVDRWYQDADVSSSANSTHGFAFTQVFPVAGGPVTYYLNADNNGSGFTLFLYPGAVASVLFVPASLPVASPAPGTPQNRQVNQ